MPRIAIHKSTPDSFQSLPGYVSVRRKHISGNLMGVLRAVGISTIELTAEQHGLRDRARTHPLCCCLCWQSFGHRFFGASLPPETPPSRLSSPSSSILMHLLAALLIRHP